MKSSGGRLLVMPAIAEKGAWKEVVRDGDGKLLWRESESFKPLTATDRQTIELNFNNPQRLTLTRDKMRSTSPRCSFNPLPCRILRADLGHSTGRCVYWGTEHQSRGLLVHILSCL